MATRKRFEPPIRCNSGSNGSSSHSAKRSINSSECDADRSSSSTESSSPHLVLRLSDASPKPVPMLSSTARESAVSVVRGRQARPTGSASISLPPTIENIDRKISSNLNFSCEEAECSKGVLRAVPEADVEVIDISDESEQAAFRTASSAVQRFATALSSAEKSVSLKKPLEEVIAVVDAWSGGSNVGQSVITVLERLGATVRARMAKDVTHVVYSEGRRLNLADLSKRKALRIVSLLWVTECMKRDSRVCEKDFPAEVEYENSPFAMPFEKKKLYQRRKCMVDFCSQPTDYMDKVKKREQRALKAKLKKHLERIDPFSPGHTPKMSKSLAKALEGDVQGLYQYDIDETDGQGSKNSGNLVELDVEQLLQPVTQPSLKERNEMNQLKKKLQGLDQDEGVELREDRPLAQVIYERLYAGPGAKFKGSPVPHDLLNQVKAVSAQGEMESATEGEEEDVIESSSVSIGSVHAVKRKIVQTKSVAVNTSNNTSAKRQSSRITKNNAAKMVVACSQTTPGLHRLDDGRKLTQIDDIIDQVCAMALATPKANEKPKRLQKAAKEVDRGQAKATTKRQKAARDIRISRQQMKKMFDSEDEIDCSALRPVQTKSTALNAILSRPSDDDFYPTNALAKKAILKRKAKRRALVVLHPDMIVCEVAEAAVGKFGKFVVGSKVTRDTTHVIVGTENLMSIDVFMAIAVGAYMLPPEWLYSSIENDKWLAEVNFELVDDFPTAKERRLEGGASSLLSTSGAIYVSPQCHLPCADLAQLIRLSGGKVTASRLRADIIIGDNVQESPYNAKLVSSQWLCDSVKRNRLIES